MANIELSVDVPMVVAVILAELMSVFYFNDRTPWGRRFGQRYLVSAVISDVGLVFLIKFIVKNYYGVSDVENAVKLGVFLGLLFVCLEGPHWIHNANSFSSFAFHALHKALIVFVIAFSLFYFKDLKI